MCSTSTVDKITMGEIGWEVKIYERNDSEVVRVVMKMNVKMNEQGKLKKRKRIICKDNY